MWMLHFIPDNYLHLAVSIIILAGIIIYSLSLVMNLIPGVLLYKEPVRILGTIVFAAGIYFYGGYSTEMEWRQKVAEAEVKVAEAEAKSKETNKQVVAKIIVKNKIIKQQEIVYRERVKEIAAQVDAKCIVDPRIVKAINDAAKEDK
jgi:hypothetical protein